jgi:hypothetical protein
MAWNAVALVPGGWLAPAGDSVEEIPDQRRLVGSELALDRVPDVVYGRRPDAGSKGLVAEPQLATVREIDAVYGDLDPVEWLLLPSGLDEQLH